MMAIGLLLVFCWIGSGVGRTALDRLKLPYFSALERLAFATALGLGLSAYGVWVLGLCGLLTFWPITVWWLLLAGVGIPGMQANVKEAAQWKSQRLSAKSSNTYSYSPNGFLLSDVEGLPQIKNAIRWVINAAFVILLLFGAIALLACFRPPGPLEWDAISYHLADPKLFLMQHRIVSLPTEHHSNFPFTMEMLFTVGLLYNGYALANAFHFVMAVLTVIGLIGFCGRVFHPIVGWLASVLFVSTPLVLWEASVAYIDLGLALFTMLATFAAISTLEENRRGEKAKARQGTGDKDQEIQHALLLSGLLMGFALGMKYLALLPFACLGLLLLARRVPVKRAVVYAAAALVIGSPWYIKNMVVMSNPVYPFLFRVFPHSAYWSQHRAEAYQSEQDKFGTKPESRGVSAKFFNLLQAPWHLLTRSNLYCNPGEYTFTALIGGLYAALIFPLAFVRRIPYAARDLLWVALGQMVAWFVLSQVSRYLIQIMPLLAIVGAYATFRFAFAADYTPAATRNPKKGVVWQTLPGLLGLTAIFGQAAYVLLSVCTLPMNAGRQERIALQQLGQMPSSVSVPVLITNAGHEEVWAADLRRWFGAYSAEEWINQNTPLNAGVALYEETRGYYLDRPYLWANQQHSSYIPYESLHNGAELTAWMNAHGIYYALINLAQTSQNNQTGKNGQHLPDPDFLNGPNGYEEAAMHKWYDGTAGVGDRGHQLVGDAVQRGLWTPLFTAHECIVLQMGPEPGPTPKQAAIR